MPNFLRVLGILCMGAGGIAVLLLMSGPGLVPALGLGLGGVILGAILAGFGDLLAYQQAQTEAQDEIVDRLAELEKHFKAIASSRQ